ncbi:MAG: hypothetical protein GX242_03850 [Clostridiales bacterium]|nr:hypothetical protein [Clostridiales bacterium]
MSNLKILNKVFFWGALWGIFEATIGYLLHLLPINIGYLFWFPLAVFFMERAYKSTGKLYSVLLIAVFASIIKLTNLFTGIRIDKVINPAASIILEGLTVFLAYHFFNKLPTQNKATKAAIISLSWRFLYIIYLLFIPEFMYSISALASRQKLIHFLLIESVFNFLFIYVYYLAKPFVAKKNAPIAIKNFAFMPLITAFLVALDVAATILL